MRYFWRHVDGEAVALACLLDGLALVLVTGVALALLALGAAPPDAYLAASATLVLGLPTLYYAHAYDPPRLENPLRSAWVVLQVGGMALVLVGCAGALGWIGEVSLRAVVASLALATPTVAGLRWKLPSILERVRRRQRILVLGTDELAIRIGEGLSATPRLGVALAGYVTMDGERPAGPAGRAMLGDASEVGQILKSHEIDRIVIASARLPAAARDALLQAWASGVPVESGLGFYERLNGRLFMRSVGAGVFALEAPLSPHQPGDFAKRGLDLIGGCVGLLLGAPLLLAAGLAIRLESPGGVLFAQDRIGRHGRLFRLYKLRSMRSDAERGGARWADDADARVTRVGRFLRKTRIDEIPQLWNVLRGEMSLVGPRPERPEFADQLSHAYPYFSLRSMVRPGLTGWAQVRHGYVNDLEGWEHKLELDLYYVKNRSIAMDLLILLQTVRILVQMKGV